jgi:hypothetical protein
MDKKALVIILIVVAFILPVLLYPSVMGLEPPMPIEETVRDIPLLDQTVVVLTAFVIKPLYMLLSLILAWALRKSHDSSLIPLRWGLLAFFIGEAFCAINYLVFHDHSHLAEYLHNFGMVTSFGFICYALLDGLDKRVIQYSDPGKRCALIGLCGSCIKSQEVLCGIRKLFQLALLAFGLLTFIPLAAKISGISYDAYIFGTRYNYTWLKVDQLFEIRYSPSLAMVMFLLAFLVMIFSKAQIIPTMARILCSAGVGALGFGLFRLFLNSTFMQNLAWADSWEEITEFTLMVFIAYMLYLFHERFGIKIGKYEMAHQAKK